MKKVLYLLFLPFFVLSACSDTDTEPDPDPVVEPEEEKNPYETGVDLSASTFLNWTNTGINDNYYMLGYGYDATGKYAHPSSVRNKVIDIDKYAESPYSSIEFHRSTSSGMEMFIEGTPSECIEWMGEKAGFSAQEIRKYKNLFRGTFHSPFANDSSFPDLAYEYFGASDLFVLYHIYFLYMDYTQKRFQSQFLTDTFKADIEILSAEEILKKYGTHILSKIKLGQRMDYLYRFAGDDNNNSYNWFLYNMPRYFSHVPSAIGSKPGKNPPLKENMYIEVVDGVRHDSNAWMIDITNYQGQRIEFHGWDTITEDQITLVAFRNEDGLIPIYEMVADPDKKAELIQAYEKYLSE